MSATILPPALGQDLFRLLPRNPDGWGNTRTDHLYTPETLYDYIDGGAELYLSYNMKEVASRIISQGDNEIRIEVFDMQEAKNAFGVFTHTRTKDQRQYGQGSQEFVGALIFWKGRYFVAITANDNNREISDAMHQLGQQIEARITEEGETPAILNLLPTENLDEDGFLYFHHYIWLNAYHYISNENILNISDKCDAVLAKYGKKEKRTYLLIIRYPDETKAREGYSSLLSELYEGDDDPQMIEDGSFIGSALTGKYLQVVFNAATAVEASELLNLTENKIKKNKTN